VFNALIFDNIEEMKCA